MRDNPDRLAWAILLASFFICIGLTVAIPLGVRHYVFFTCVAQNVTLEVQRAPLRVIEPGRSQPVSVAEDLGELSGHTTVATYAASFGRLVMHAPQADDSTITTVQLYGNTEVVLSSARSPRFSASRLPHEIVLEVRTGRVRINVADDDGRPTIVEVKTPHGSATLTEGSYEVEVNAKTKFTVHHGQAEVAKNELVTPLDPDEQAVVDDEQIVGPLPAPRNLIINGYFSHPLEENWRSYNKDIEFEGESGGEVWRTEIESHPVAVITREGIGHAETGITQQLGVDVHEFSSLQLHLLLYIEEQDVPMCGSEGSECPVMVRIDYEDARGRDQEWLQGFYWQPDPSGQNPAVCRTCPTRNPHIRVKEGTWYPYLSPNLIPLLSSQDGQAPTVIKSITIYASGHSYRSTIAEVELIGRK